MNENSEQIEIGTLDSAIRACELNIRRHRSLALITMTTGILLLLVVILSAGTYATLTSESVDNVRLKLLDLIKSKQQDVYDLKTESKYESYEIRRLQSDLEKLQEAKPNGNPPDKDSLSKWEEDLSSANKKIENAKNSYAERHQKARDKAQLELAAANQALKDYKVPSLIPQEMMLSLVALFVIILSISTALYRFHQKEMTKNEHYKLGFLRIRIAANNNDKDGFGSEVRASLTSGAFTFHSEGLFDKKGKKLESPIPGHPTSELATVIVNKLLEQVEVVLKPK